MYKPLLRLSEEMMLQFAFVWMCVHDGDDG